MKRFCAKHQVSERQEKATSHKIISQAFRPSLEVSSFTLCNGSSVGYEEEVQAEEQEVYEMYEGCKQEVHEVYEDWKSSRREKTWTSRSSAWTPLESVEAARPQNWPYMAICCDFLNPHAVLPRDRKS